MNAGLDSGPMVDLSERVALVTGAAGPAGRAVVAALAAAGARVALIGSTLERVEAVAHELGLDRDGWLAVGADLRDAAQARDAVGAVLERFGRIDVLAHLVGGWTGGVPASETPDDAFRSMLDQHLWTTVNVARTVVPVMVEAGFGRIVAVSSPVVTETPARTAAYTVGKAAEEAMIGSPGQGDGCDRRDGQRPAGPGDRRRRGPRSRAQRQDRGLDDPRRDRRSRPLPLLAGGWHGDRGPDPAPPDLSTEDRR